jgi:MarR family transcriptional regulator, 2-MHQ and catechol-resistance regulon repressor
MDTNAPAYQVAEPTTPARTIDTATLAWLRLARIYHKIDRSTAERFRRHDISVGRFDVLNHAGTPEGRTQQELASSLLVTKGNITQLLDAMERDGLIERQRNGRCNQIFLTPEGRERRAALVAMQEAALVEDFSTLTLEERETLLRLLRKLDRGLDARRP